MLKNSHVKIASPKPVNIRGLNLQYFSRQKIIMLSIYFVPLNPVPPRFQFQPAVNKINSLCHKTRVQLPQSKK
jgi:hypothetical protein